MMAKSIIRLVTVVVVSVLAATACIKDEPEDVWSLQVGDKVPDFSVTLNDGRIVTTESLKGKYSVIIFFNTTCVDCRRELPELQKEYERNLAEDKCVEYICISREEDAASVEAFWQGNALTMPYSVQTGRSIYNLFASSGIPRIYYISPSLIITKVILAE